MFLVTSLPDRSIRKPRSLATAFSAKLWTCSDCYTTISCHTNVWLASVFWLGQLTAINDDSIRLRIFTYILKIRSPTICNVCFLQRSKSNLYAWNRFSHLFSLNFSYSFYTSTRQTVTTSTHYSTQYTKNHNDVACRRRPQKSGPSE